MKGGTYTDEKMVVKSLGGFQFCQSEKRDSKESKNTNKNDGHSYPNSNPNPTSFHTNYTIRWV